MDQTFDATIARYLVIFAAWSSISPFAEARTAGLALLSELSSLHGLDDFPDQLQIFVDRLTEDIKGVPLPTRERLTASNPKDLTVPELINTFKFDLANDLR